MVLGHDINAGQRTQDVRISEDVSFDTMLLRSTTLKGLKNAGFLKPSPIQLHGIPLGKCGFDLLLEAKSGTGKTAVFTVITLEKLDLNKGLQTIILAPTREIASQISTVITEIGSQYKGLNVAVVMGGLPVKDDIEKFNKNVHIVVGSPGRLRHLIQAKHIDVSSVRLFVLDEADKLMESSFQPDINYIFSLLPKQKQVIMSSATYSEEAKLFISNYVQKAQHICPDSNCILLGIEQMVTVVPYNSNIVKQTKHRYEELKKILNGKQFKQCLIFCNYQVRVGELHRMLLRDKWPAEQLYGQQEQTHRLDALKTLQEYNCRILVSTDLAARGIDASNVDVVINFEPPFEWQTYLHRIGRAGRYGSYGTAISIVSEGKEKRKFIETLRLTNIQFNLRDLWDDEPFNLSLNITDDCPEENQAPVIISSNTKTANHDKTENLLWKVLTTESPEQKNDNKQEICSFEKLCDSFKLSTELSIESFAELMNSFKTNQNKVSKNKDSFGYKQVDVAELPIENIKYWNNLEVNYTKEKNDEVTINKIEQEIVDNNMNDDSVNGKEPAQKENERNLTESMAKKSKKVLSNCKDNIFENDIQIEYNAIGFEANLQESVNQKQVHQSNQSLKVETDSSKQALLDAGLPTVFGKTKFIKSTSHNSYNSNNYSPNTTLKKTKVQHRPIKGQLDRKDVKKNQSNTTYNKNIFSSNAVSGRDQSESFIVSDEISDQSDCSSKTSIDVKSMSNLKKDYAKYASSSVNNTYSRQHKSKKYKSHQVQTRCIQFDLWYNQLKHQMQFIQYSLYIEEFKKL